MIGNINNNMQEMKQENKAWIAKLTTVEKDLGDVKDSLEMAHNMIQDEKNARNNVVKELKEEMKEHAQEIRNNTSLIKTNTTDLQSVKETVKKLGSKVAQLSDDHQKLKEPIAKLSTQCETNAKQEFPLNCAKCVVPRRRGFTQDC